MNTAKLFTTFAEARAFYTGCRGNACISSRPGGEWVVRFDAAQGRKRK